MSQTLQIEEPKFTDQRWIAPVVCHGCSKLIPANTDYYRLAFEVDGADKHGKDVCVACSKNGVPNA